MSRARWTTDPAVLGNPNAPKMKIKPKHVAMVLDGLAAVLGYWVVQFCGDQLGAPTWASRVAGVVLGVLVASAVSEPIFDIYMSWSLRRMSAARRNQREDEPN